MKYPVVQAIYEEYGYLKTELAEIFRILKIGVLRHNMKLKPYPYNVE